MGLLAWKYFFRTLRVPNVFLFKVLLGVIRKAVKGIFLIVKPVFFNLVHNQRPVFSLDE